MSGSVATEANVDSSAANASSRPASSMVTDTLTSDVVTTSTAVPNRSKTSSTAATLLYGTTMVSAAAAPTLGPSSGASLALAPLTSADNLLRVWNFSNATKEWFFYDPRPAFSAANTLTEMVPGQPYWIMVVGNQSTILNGNSRSLYAGWNLIPW